MARETLKSLREKLEIQMQNNKILNIRNKNLQEEVIKYQKEVQELRGQLNTKGE